MHFIGYHGTSERAARNILTVGIQRRFLPERGQIGPGFYVARTNGELPEWGAFNATEPARRAAQRGADLATRNAFARMDWIPWLICSMTGWRTDPILDEDARPTILKIYSGKLLLRSKWNKMDSQDLRSLWQSIDEGGPNYDPVAASQWLQMVIAPEELDELVALPLNAIGPQRPENWFSHESPEAPWSQRHDNYERTLRAEARRRLFRHAESPF